MKKQLKLLIIIFFILSGIIVLDTLQAIIFKHSTLIKFEEELEDNSLVDKGILLNVYYCKNEEDRITIHFKSKLSKFSCQSENMHIINELNTYIKKLSYSNYEYNYDIEIRDYKYKYEGTKYDNHYKGIYKSLDTEIEYQIENDRCYDINTKDEIFNVHNNVNIGYIYLNNLSEFIINEKSKCTKNKSEYECNALDNNTTIKLNFYIEEKNIEKIKITDEDNFNYTMQYRNINNVQTIERLDDYYFNFGLFFEETNEIISEKIDDFGTFIFYNISKVKFVPYNKRVELNADNLEKFLKNATYKIEKYNSIKYIFKNNLIIYVSEDSKNMKHVYVTLEKYNNDILKKYLIN